MKITATFVAAAMAVSQVQGLPVIDPGTSELGLVSERGVLAKRTGSGLAGDVSKVSDFLYGLPFAGQTVATSSSLEGHALRKALLKRPHASLDPAFSASSDGPLLKNPRKTTDEDMMDIDDTVELDVPRDEGKRLRLNDQRRINRATVQALEKANFLKPGDQAIAEALVEHRNRHSVNQNAWLRLEGEGPWEGQGMRAQAARNRLSAIKSYAASTYQELVQRERQEQSTVEALSTALSNWSTETVQSTVSALNQAQKRLNEIRNELAKYEHSM